MLFTFVGGGAASLMSFHLINIDSRMLEQISIDIVFDRLGLCRLIEAAVSDGFEAVRDFLMLRFLIIILITCGHLEAEKRIALVEVDELFTFLLLGQQCHVVGIG